MKGQPKPESIPVVALKKNGDFVGEYINITDAAYKLSLSFSGIYNCISGLALSARDYIFLKKENYNPEIKTTYLSLKRRKSFIKKRA